MRRRRRPCSKTKSDVVEEKVRLHGTSQSSNDEEEREVQLWSPDCRLSEEEIKKYLVDAQKKNMSSEKAAQASLRSRRRRIAPRNQAHEILAYCKFNIRKALTLCEHFVVPDLFSDFEKQVVRCTIRAEKFRLLKCAKPHQRCQPLKNLLPQQSTSSIMNYYYKNKFNNFEFIPRRSRYPKRQCVIKRELEEIESCVSLAAEMARRMKVVRPKGDPPPVAVRDVDSFTPFSPVVIPSLG
ncbi:hypothetical protein Y032_0148g2631 [Ancylostoma ceylanicum]|uniref:ELM2 domain-containing protein n=1 Tax=Ancylostoma ceylanicum TaxID=53326 RepID=A0A016T0Z0_9BILA|nr:hypothetical protein Y032_0148g2631 [Ancylostoma ceylanicum]